MNRTLALMLTVSLLAGCGGDEAGGGSNTDEQVKPVEEKPAEATAPADGGFDLSALKEATGRQDEDAPETGGGGDEGGGDVEATPAPEMPEAPVEAPPKRLEDITDDEVMASFDADEREALQEMPEEERASFLEERRERLFTARGGVLDESSGRMEDQAVDESTGMRGPARPDTPAKELPPPDLRGILQDLSSRDPETRARGAESAKRFEDKAVATKHILPVLDDPDAELRAIAASTLGALGRPESLPRLDQALRKDTAAGVRAMALRAIRDIGGEASTDVMRRFIKDGEDPVDRATALSLLTDMEKPELVKDLMVMALDDLGFQVRRQAVMTVRTFDLKEHAPTLLPLLEDFDENVVLESVRALGQFKTREAVGPLVKILVHPDEDWEMADSMQDAAADALKSITGEDNGYSGTLPDEKRLAAIDSWRIWWEKNKSDWK